MSRLGAVPRIALTLATLLCPPFAAVHAQGTPGTGQPNDAPTPAQPSGDGASWLPDMAREAREAAKSAGDTISTWWNEATTLVTPNGPTAYLPSQISEDDKQFFAVLGAAGLTLKEVTVGKGVVPAANYHFVASRDPTSTDLARAEDLLRAYRQASDGMRARAKQRIARATLDTMATAGFTLSAMDVTLSPWPDASYQVTTRPPAAARDAPTPGR